jgi:hypothetical protein
MSLVGRTAAAVIQPELTAKEKRFDSFLPAS